MGGGGGGESLCIKNTGLASKVTFLAAILCAMLGMLFSLAKL